MLLLLCRLVDVKIGFSFYYDNSTTDNIAPIDIWLVFSENKIHAFFFNTKYNRINIISAITRRFFSSSFPRFQLVSSFYRAYTLIVSCFSRACWMQSINYFPRLQYWGQMLSRQSQFFTMLQSSITCLLPLAIALAKDFSIFLTGT